MWKPNKNRDGSWMFNGGFRWLEVDEVGRLSTGEDKYDEYDEYDEFDENNWFRMEPWKGERRRIFQKRRSIRRTWDSMMGRAGYWVRVADACIFAPPWSIPS